MKYLRWVFAVFFLFVFVISPGAQFTTPTTDNVIATEEYDPPPTSSEVKYFRWEINGASESATCYTRTTDTNYPTGRPINTTKYGMATIQIAEVTGIGNLMSLSTTPLVIGDIGSATRTYWVEGKIGATASNVVNYVTLPMREVAEITIGSATTGERWWRSGVSQFGVYKVDLRGIQSVRVKCGGGTVQDASAAIWAAFTK